MHFCVTFNVEVMRTTSMPVSEIQRTTPANGTRLLAIVHALIASHRIPVSSAHAQWEVHQGCMREMGDGIAEPDICGCNALNSLLCNKVWLDE